MQTYDNVPTDFVSESAHSIEVAAIRPDVQGCNHKSLSECEHHQRLVCA